MTEPGTNPPSPASSARRYVAAMAGIALAVLLLVWVMQFAQLTGEDVMRFLREHGWTLLFAATVSIGLQSWCSALKWRQLQLSSDGNDGKARGRIRLTVYTSLATLFAQVLPAPIAVPLVRGIATRFDLRGTFVQGAAITVYDQMFDVGVLIVGALVCAGLFLIGATPAVAVASSLILLALLVLLARPAFALLKPLALARRLVPERLPGMARIAATLDFAHRRGLDSPDMAALLTRWSVLRYLAIGLRSAVAILLIAPALGWADAAWGFAVVQSSALLALTPGNIGITEWGWAGIEAVLAVEPGLFVLAILGLRIVQLPATLIVLVLSWLALRLSPAD